MNGIVGIKFESSSRVYGFRTDGVEVRKGDLVVVESELGMSIGKVVAMDFEMDAAEREVKPILRKATGEDMAKDSENESLKAEAMAFCNERIMARGLPMKLVSTEVTLDRKRIIFYFVADNRIDFRELVKDLASKFRTRIELRQIGVRDAAMLVGGLGICGREFCCRSFLKSFYPISINMAKQQDLVLNTAKLSGTCGRLMCCLYYEYDKARDRKIKGKSAGKELTVETGETEGEQGLASEEEQVPATEGAEAARPEYAETPRAEAPPAETPPAEAKAAGPAAGKEGEGGAPAGAGEGRRKRKRWRRKKKKKK